MLCWNSLGVIICLSYSPISTNLDGGEAKLIQWHILSLGQKWAPLEAMAELC